MRHMLVIGPWKMATACRIRVSAHYPHSRTALCLYSEALINVSLCMEDVDCPRCLAAVGLKAASPPSPREAAA